jgi:tRNA-dihydrouridine synthase B
MEVPRNVPGRKRAAVRRLYDEVDAVLSPMAGVTDRVFRAVCRDHGAQLTWCEFVSANGVLHGNPASFDLMELGEDEHPVGIQLFGSDPVVLARAARTAQAVGPDLIDLNFGCPVKKVVKRNGGSALLCNVPLMEEIVRAVVEAVDLPVTAKIRIGWNRDQLNYLEVTAMLQEAGACAITVHGRTRDQLFNGRADWRPIAEMVEAADVPVIGNGDVFSGDDYFRMKAETRCDAVMIARGAIGNPFLFEEIRVRRTGGTWTPPTVAAVVDVMIDHLDRELVLKGPRTGMMRMRRHFSQYLKGHPGAAHLRRAVFAEVDRDRVVALLEEYRRVHGDRRVA